MGPDDGGHGHTHAHGEKGVRDYRLLLEVPEGILGTEGRPGGDYFYVARQLVVHHEDVPRVRDGLARFKAEPVEEDAGGQWIRFELGSDEPVPEVVDELRRAALATEAPLVAADDAEGGEDDPGRLLRERLGMLARRWRPQAEASTIRVYPHLVLAVANHMRWAPATLPTAADRPELPEASDTASGPTVVILDTGAADHKWFAGRVDHQDDDEADADGDGRLDPIAGHGTFMAGLVLQVAPMARVVVRRIVPALAVTDFDVAKAVDVVEYADVVVLSLGGYNTDNTPLPAVAAAIRRLEERLPGCVVVAAAGNDGVNRPFWPAAMKGVIGVGALDRRGRPARFSNHGDWVDACAPGDGLVSTYLDFDGEQEPTGLAVGFQGWARWSGTSFATPVIAGAIAAAMGSGLDARTAAFELIGRPGLTRVPPVGVAVPVTVATA